MEDINIVYYNDFGIAFQWKRCAVKGFRKIQIIFRNTGLFLTQSELLQFYNNIEVALNSPYLCNDCIKDDSCKSLLLEAPNPQTSFSMSYLELKEIQDLIKGVLFQLGLDNLLKNSNIHKI